MDIQLYDRIEDKDFLVEFVILFKRNKIAKNWLSMICRR